MALTSIPVLGDMGLEVSFSRMGYVALWGWGFSAVTAEAPLWISAVSPMPWQGCVKLLMGSEERDETKESGFSASGNQGWEGGLPLNVLPLEPGLPKFFWPQGFHSRTKWPVLPRGQA